MQTKHTPGPWVIGGSVISNGKIPVARVLHNGNGNPSRASDYDREAPRWVDGADANARLIAAAPDLLAALRELVTNNMGQPKGVTVPQLDNARTAIAKATGGQP